MTWYRIKPNNRKDFNSHSTFQLVFTADDEHSYIIYNYDSLAQKNDSSHILTQAGYYLGAINKEYYFNASLLSDMNSFSKSSNCNIKGKYIFRFDNSGNNYLFT